MRKLLQKLIIHKKEFGVFPKVFLTLMLVMIIPTIVLSVLNYNISARNLEKEVNRSNLDTLRQTRVAVDNILKSTENIAVQIARNKEVLTFFERRLDISSYDNIEMIKRTIDVIDTIMEGNEHIGNISICSSINSAVISSGMQSFQSLDSQEMDKKMKLYNDNKTGLWLEPSQRENSDAAEGVVRYMKFIHSHFRQPLGYVSIHLKNNEFVELINEIYIRKNGYIIVSNEKGDIVMNGKRSIPGLSEFKPASSIIDNFEGYEKISMGSKKLLVSYTTSKYNKWKYIAIVPVNELGSTVYAYSNNLLIIFLLYALLSVFLSLAISKGFYNPIMSTYNILHGAGQDMNLLRKMESRKDEFGKINREINNIIRRLGDEMLLKNAYENENVTLRKELDLNISQLRNFFLYKLFYGDSSNIRDILDQASFLEIPADSIYIVVIAEFDKNFDAIVYSLKDDQQSALKDGILSLLENSFSNGIKPVRAFYEGKEKMGRILAVLNYNAPIRDDYDELIRSSCKTFQQIIFSKFKLTVAIAIGTACEGLENIRKSYSEALHVLKYKFILGSNIILSKKDVDEALLNKPRQNYYKKQLINSLNSRNAEEIKNILENFKNSVSYTPDYIFYCKDIINFLIEYLKEINYTQQNDIGELSGVLENLENTFDNIDEVISWLHAFMMRLLNHLNGEEGMHFNKLINQAVSIVEKNYHRDLSLSDVAEKLSISESYLSRLFKDKLQKNFKQFLTERKIEKAKELLVNTELTIREISSSVGYNSHKQFCLMFKSVEGITAYEYRNAFRGKSEKQQGPV